MNNDFTPYFKNYEALVHMVEDIFTKVKKEFPKQVKCKITCSDCCFALFDLTLVEALYINHHFNSRFDGSEKLKLIDRANTADRKIYKIKRDAHKEFQQGKNEVEILGSMAKERVRCPMLNDDDRCDIYEFRPVTCRLYGIPTSASGMSHTCGCSGFAEGETYPTVNMDTIYRQLFDISAHMVKQMKTKYVKMADMLVPLSMAIITEFSDDYLGISKRPAKDGENRGEEDV